MDEENVTGNPVDDNPVSGSSGGSPVGDEGSGSQVDLQSQLEAAEERRRHFQGLSDKRQAEIERLEKKVADSGFEDRLGGLEEQLKSLASMKIPSVEDIAAAVSSTQRMAEFRSDVAKRYPGVDADSIVGATPDEIEAAAKQEFERVDAIRKSAREEALAEFRKEQGGHYRMADANGDAADQGAGSVPGDGELTPEDFLRMDEAAQDAVPSEQFDKLMAHFQAKGGPEWTARSVGSDRE